ncbi:MAG: phosphatidate cytidylyltransferase [Bacteroidales bacterium]|nr:phosphatidate cytidylyltransferase [Bacteroidales bacterium]
MKDLVKRTLTGAVYVISVIVATCINKYVAAIYFGIIVLLGLKEFLQIAISKGIHQNKVMVYLSSVLIYASVVAFAWNAQPYASILMFSGLLSVLGMLISALYLKNETPFTSLAYSFTSILYITLPLALSNMIYAMQSDVNCNLLLAIFIFAWCNDTFAYLVGCKFGKKRLFERHSPKKSWEGFFGGLSATIIAAVVMYLIYGNGLVAWLLIAILTSVVGTLGDLVESMFKRQMGVKDSGNILPGHGGILDRFDILLLVLPAVWICLSLLGQFFPVF